MAGVPKIMQAMMDAIAPTLKGGKKILSQTVDCEFGEGAIGAPLGKIQVDNPDTMIGSYPRYENGNHSTQIVVRARDQALVNTATGEVEEMLAEIRRSKASSS